MRSCFNCSATLSVWVNREREREREREMRCVLFDREDVWCFEWQRQVKFWLSREVMF